MQQAAVLLARQQPFDLFVAFILFRPSISAHICSK